MSTRSVIAIGTRDEWHGVYVHYDGYPEGVGRQLWALVHMQDGDLWDQMTACAVELIDAHPEGWLYLPDSTETGEHQHPDGECFLDGDMRYSGGPLPGGSIEWVYILEPETGQMHIGDRERIVASVDLAGQEPDWDALRQ
jgi:hypothetical protein